MTQYHKNSWLSLHVFDRLKNERRRHVGHDIHTWRLCGDVIIRLRAVGWSSYNVFKRMLDGVPSSHPRVEPGHTRSLRHRRWLPSRLQNSESTSYAQIADLRHQTVYTVTNTRNCRYMSRKLNPDDAHGVIEHSGTCVNLRDRLHNRQLPDRISHLTNCNFTVRMLFCDSLHSLFTVLHLFCSTVQLRCDNCSITETCDLICLSVNTFADTLSPKIGWAS